MAYSSQESHTGQLDSSTDWQMASLWDEIRISPHLVYLPAFLIKSTTSQSSSYPIHLKRVCGLSSSLIHFYVIRLAELIKLIKCIKL